MTVLDEILAATRLEIARLRAAPAAPSARVPIDVRARLRRGDGEPLRLVAEIKKRSPSAGALSTALSVEARARVYAEAGAAMLSVLVDRAHFDGGYHDLAAARAAVPTPLLGKGFVLDPIQLVAAHAAGADAVLLIVRIVDDPTLRSLVTETRRLGMTPLVEVTDEAELARALAAGADAIGVNARDLATLQMDAARAARVLGRIPADAVALFFSGLGAPVEVQRVATAREGRRVDGALVGEALMRRDDPGPLLRAMIAAAATP